MHHIEFNGVSKSFSRHAGRQLLRTRMANLFKPRDRFHALKNISFRIEEGEGVVRIDGVDNRVADDFAVIVPAGARHNVINSGEAPLKLYTIYGPPEHRDGVVHRDKEQAERDHDDDHWDGGTTE